MVLSPDTSILNSKYHHKRWHGHGPCSAQQQVQHVLPETVVILFPQVGYDLAHHLPIEETGYLAGVQKRRNADRVQE